MLTLPTTMSRALLGTGGSRYLPETLAWAAAHTTPPTASWLALVDSYIRARKADGSWGKFDFLYLLCGETDQGARLNLVNPALFTLTKVNSPTFTASQGFAGDGAASYLNTGFNPGDGGTYKFLQDDAQLSLWSRTNLSDANMVDAGHRTSSSASQTMIGTRLSGSLALRINVNTAATFTVGDSLGLYMNRRTGPTVSEGWKNGTSRVTSANVSVPVKNAPVLLCCVNNVVTAGGVSPANFSTRQFAMFSAGGALNDAQALNFYNDTLALLQTIGAA